MEKNIQSEELDNLEKGFNEIENQETKSNSEDGNIVVTQVQQEIIKEIAKLDVELEQLNSITPNIDEFYDSLDDLLSDEEKYLQEENPKEYLKLVDKKKQEFLNSKSNDSKKAELEEKRKELELKNAIELGVVEVTKLYKDYNHLEMQTFFSKKLNQEEKDEIINSSKNTFDIFKKTHEKFLEKSGKAQEIKKTPAPNTPDFSKVIKQPITNSQINQIDSEEEKYKKALGV